jgi:hypothetical protein
VSHGSAGWAFAWPPGPLTGEIRPSSHKERRQAPGEGEPQQHEGPVYSITGLVKLAIARGVLTIEDAGLAVEGEVVRADPYPHPLPKKSSGRAYLGTRARGSRRRILTYDVAQLSNRSGPLRGRFCEAPP